MDIKDIIEGHVNELFDKHDKLSEERLSICRKCPLIKESSFGPICDSNKWINPRTGEVSDTPKLNYKRGCACRLNAKTRLIHNHCIILKW